jgi:hypothetical protein
MPEYHSIVEKFLTHMIEVKELRKLPFDYVKQNWGINYKYFNGTQLNPYLRSFFKFCKDNRFCPVETLILYNKAHINPARLILFIRKTFNYHEDIAG